MNILSVEDEPQLSLKISQALEKAGHLVACAHTGPDGLRMALNYPTDVVVLDVNLPGCDGYEVLAELRKRAPNTPRIIMLTARGELPDRVQGLRGGADDYLTKPFAMEELIARVEALGRRPLSSENAQVLRLGNLWMEVIDRRVKLNGQLVNLSPREFEVLQVLMKHPGRIFSRDELCEQIWQREHEYDTRTVEIFIMRLRKKLDDGQNSVNIETVRGVGYRILGPAQQAAS